MAHSSYPWKRFWSPRSAEFRFADGGYFWDPDGDPGRLLNPDAVSFEGISGVPCLVLLGEPGIGKSTAVQASQSTLKFDLGAFQADNSLTSAIFLHPQFQAWLQERQDLTLSLDSLDEGRLAISNIVKILLREFKNIQGGVNRLRLRIACRTADWPLTFERGLRELWGEKNVAVYQLAPLRRRDVAIAAEVNGLATDAFLREVERREAIPFAIKPVTLEFLVASYKKRQSFPATKSALYLEGCRGLCEESDARREAGWTGDLSADARIGIASRIAALTIFGGFSAVWKGPDRGDVPDGDISIRRLAGGVERIKNIDIDIDIDEHAISEVLGTGLFISRGMNRLGWSHHTYAEFLAAYYLVERQFTVTQAMSLFTIPDDKEGKLAPQLYETAAWLASMRPEFFRQIMVADPSVLLLSDVATADPADREKLVETLLKLYDEEKLLDSNWGLRSLYRKLAHPTLDQQLLPYISDRTKGNVVRRVAIDIAEACDLRIVQPALVALALDRLQNVPTRTQAAYAILRIGDAETKARLKILAIEPLAEDTQDELKGCALRATWPQWITAGELFDALTPPKDKSLAGSYSVFLASELLGNIQCSHLPAALKWLTHQRTRRELTPWLEKIADSIMDLAWSHLDDEGILDSFVQVIEARVRSHDAIIGSSRKTAHELFTADDDRRHRIVTSLISHFSIDDLPLLAWSIPGLGRGGDFFWLLEQYKQCTEPGLKTKWLTLIERVFFPLDQLQLQAILAEAQSDSAVATAVGRLIDPVQLGSPQARILREAYEENERLEREMRAQQDRPLLSPPPAESIALLLQRFEEGCMKAWWLLLSELELEPDSTHYDSEREADITTLPGWKAASPQTRDRIMRAAQMYLLNGDPQNDEWLGQTGIWYRPAAAGARAFLLLHRERPDSLQDFEGGVWNKWAASLLVYPSSGSKDYSESNRLMLQMAYACAAREVIRAALIIIDKENQQSDYVMVLDSLAPLWDTGMADALYAKCQDQLLKPVFVGALLHILMEHGYGPAAALAVSLIPTPLPREGRLRELAMVAAAALLRYGSGTGWPVFWPAFQTDREFGKDVLASLTRLIDFQGTQLSTQLDEDQLAEFYLWLLETYPEEEPEDDSTWAGSRDFASHWRNGILHLLQSRGTERACEAILRLMRARPDQTYLKWSLHTARESTRMRQWKPVPPEHILQMARDTTKRLVRGGEELLAVILESLGRLTIKLRGDTPLVSNLWNEVSIGKWKPKDEEHLSDNVKQHLEDHLRAKGIVLNREVVIRRKHGTTRGERTDIHVDAVIPGGADDALDIITVIIEVKGCWNRELWTAMKSQLVDRYLHETHTRHGLYLVGWFNCAQWNAKDTRTKPVETLPEAEERLEQQAHDLSEGSLILKSFVLDTSMR